MSVPQSHVNISQLLAERKDCIYHKIREPETMSLPLFSLRPVPEWNRADFSESFVIEIPMGRVFGQQGVIITPDNKLVEEVCFEWKSSINNHSVKGRKSMPEMKFFDGTLAVLAGQAPANYYHWMFEIIPRIKTLKDSGISFDKLYVPYLRFKFQRQSLEFLGFTKNDLLEGGQEVYIQAKRLVVPSLPNRVCPTNPSWALKYLREEFLGKSDTHVPQTKRLYISRKEVTTDWARRYIINDWEVIPYLAERGFEKVVLEDITIQEQAKLFNAAEVIIGTHGAGLSNLVFCQPGTKVLEFFHPELLNEAYIFLSDQLNLQHDCILTPMDGFTSEQKAQGDIVIPIDTLEKALNRLQIM